MLIIPKVLALEDPKFNKNTQPVAFDIMMLGYVVTENKTTSMTRY